MNPDPAAIFRQAIALWRRDRPILLPLTGLFIFVAQYAALLLIPAFPQPAGEGAAGAAAWQAALEQWMGRYGAGFLSATLIAQFGAFVVVTLYCAAPRPAVGEGMVKALSLFLRYLLASAIVTFPCAMGALAAMAVPGGLAFAFLPIMWILARTALMGPVIVAERRGAVAAVMRSWALTTGHGLSVTLIVGSILLTGQLVGSVVLALESGIGTGAANPVVRALIDGGAAGVSWAAATMLSLVIVTLYRRLAS